jgi:hypothetical protein
MCPICKHSLCITTTGLLATLRGSFRQIHGYVFSSTECRVGTQLPKEAHEATQVANEILNQFVAGDQQTVINGRKIAARYLGDKVSSHEVYESGKTPIVFGTGHCHIDSCWLWPFDETKRMHTGRVPIIAKANCS